MNKVICINDKPLFGEPEAVWILKTGNVYEVISELKYNGFDYYELAEQPGVAYCVEHFAPLSEIDETEFERSYNKELV